MANCQQLYKWPVHSTETAHCTLQWPEKLYTEDFLTILLIQTFEACVLHMSTAVVGGALGDQLSSRHADTLLAAMAQTAEFDDVLAMQKWVKAFMVQQINQVATNDLLAIMSAAEGEINFSHVNAALKNCKEWDHRLNDLVETFMQTLTRKIISLATCHALA